MDLSKTLGGSLAASRLLFGASYLARPVQARSQWIGRAAKKPGTQLIIRSQASRDLALGAGALYAIARGESAELRRWMLAHTLADATDFAATWFARDDLPKRRAGAAMALAGASALVAVGAVASAGASD